MTIGLYRWMDVALDDVFAALTVVGEGKRVAAGLDSLAHRHWENRGIDIVPIGSEGLALVVVYSESGCWSDRASELQVPVRMDWAAPEDEDGLELSIPDWEDLPPEWQGILQSQSAQWHAPGVHWPLLWTSGSDGRYHRYTRLPSVLAGWALKMTIRKEGERITLEKGLVEGVEHGGYVDPVRVPSSFLPCYDALGWEWLGSRWPDSAEPASDIRVDRPMFLGPRLDPEAGQPAEEPMADWERELLEANGEAE